MNQKLQIPGAIDTLEEAQAYYSDLHLVYWFSRPPEKFTAGPAWQSTWYLRQHSEELTVMLVAEVRREHRIREAA
jgi:hypothetical protein